MKKPETQTATINGNVIKYWRINNDTNGNPRYVVHYLSVAPTYDEAIEKARKIGGKKYNAKWFGGGIVFQSYNVAQELTQIID